MNKTERTVQKSNVKLTETETDRKVAVAKGEQSNGRWLKNQITLEPLLSNSRCPPFPAIAFVVTEHKIITVQVMDDAVDTTVAFDVLHLVATAESLALSVRDIMLPIRFVELIQRGLSLEQGDAETTRLEDFNDLLDDVGGGLAILRVRHVGLKGCVRTLRLRCDMHSEVVGRGVATRSRHNAVGREATWSEEIRIDASIRELALGVHVGQAARLRDDSAQGMALGG
jgi:hypothetical protein